MIQLHFDIAKIVKLIYIDQHSSTFERVQYSSRQNTLLFEFLKKMVTLLDSTGDILIILKHIKTDLDFSSERHS